MRQKLPVWAQSGDWHRAMIMRRIFASKLPPNVFWVLIRRGLDRLGGRRCRGHAIPTPSLQLHWGGWDTNSGGLFSNVQLYTLYSGPIKPVVRIVKLNFVLFVCLCALIVRQGGGGRVCGQWEGRSVPHQPIRGRAYLTAGLAIDSPAGCEILLANFPTQLKCKIYVIKKHLFTWVYQRSLLDKIGQSESSMGSAWPMGGQQCSWPGQSPSDWAINGD